MVDANRAYPTLKGDFSELAAIAMKNLTINRCHFAQSDIMALGGLYGLSGSWLRSRKMLLCWVDDLPMLTIKVRAAQFGNRSLTLVLKQWLLMDVIENSGKPAGRLILTQS